LVSINGKTSSELKEKVEVATLVGPTTTGGLSDYRPVTLSLFSLEKSKTAKTPMWTNSVYQIGFRISMLNPEDWNPAGTKVILRVDPVKDCGYVIKQPVTPK